jgi:hypothetical protein
MNVVRHTGVSRYLTMTHSAADAGRVISVIGKQMAITILAMRAPTMRLITMPERG